jgi:hypothetical protein
MTHLWTLSTCFAGWLIWTYSVIVASSLTGVGWLALELLLERRARRTGRKRDML